MSFETRVTAMQQSVSDLKGVKNALGYRRQNEQKLKQRKEFQ